MLVTELEEGLFENLVVVCFPDESLLALEAVHRLARLATTPSDACGPAHDDA